MNADLFVWSVMFGLLVVVVIALAIWDKKNRDLDAK